MLLPSRLSVLFLYTYLQYLEIAFLLCSRRIPKYVEIKKNLLAGHV